MKAQKEGLHKSREWICKTCGKRWSDEYETADEAVEAEPDYFFYQRKKMGSTTYVIDYNFCSKECMVKYLKKKK